MSDWDNAYTEDEIAAGVPSLVEGDDSGYGKYRQAPLSKWTQAMNKVVKKPEVGRIYSLNWLGVMKYYRCTEFSPFDNQKAKWQAATKHQYLNQYSRDKVNTLGINLAELDNVPPAFREAYIARQKRLKQK